MVDGIVQSPCSRVTSRFVMAIAGGATSGWIMPSFEDVWGLHSWQRLFLLEGLPLSR